MTTKYPCDCDFSCPQSEEQKTRVIVEEYEKLSPNLIFEIIRHDGELELERKVWPLVLSALAAGLMISFSFYFRSIINVYIGSASWAEAITGVGYRRVSSSLFWDGSNFSQKIRLPRSFLFSVTLVGKISACSCGSGGLFFFLI